MTIISSIPGSGDAYQQLVKGLRMEFGCSDISALADRIFEAEKVDFHWESRVQEHYLGQHISSEFDDELGVEELSRVAILSFVACRWHAGICLVDGEGNAADLLWLRSFDQREDAMDVFVRAR